MGKTGIKRIKQYSIKKLLKVFYPASDSDVNIRQVGERKVIHYLNLTDAHGKDANIILRPFRVNQKRILN